MTDKLLNQIMSFIHTLLIRETKSVLSVIFYLGPSLHQSASFTTQQRHSRSYKKVLAKWKLQLHLTSLKLENLDIHIPVFEAHEYKRGNEKT